jgi:hypothetical protein
LWQYTHSADAPIVEVQPLCFCLNQSPLQSFVGFVQVTFSGEGLTEDSPPKADKYSACYRHLMADRQRYFIDHKPTSELYTQFASRYENRHP